MMTLDEKSVYQQSYYKAIRHPDWKMNAKDQMSWQLIEYLLSHFLTLT